MTIPASPKKPLILALALCGSACSPGWTGGGFPAMGGDISGDYSPSDASHRIWSSPYGGGELQGWTTPGGMFFNTEGDLVGYSD